MLRIGAIVATLLIALAGCAESPPPPVSTEPPPSAGQAPVASPAPADASATPSAAGAAPKPVPTSGKAQVLHGEKFRTLVAGAEGARQALISGRLAVGEGGCLVVRSAGEPESVIVWPPGVTLLTNGRVGVDVPGTGAVTVGDTFSGGGGYSEAPMTEGFPPGRYVPVPAACAKRGTPVAVIDNLDGFQVG
ncbi:hypothetical protein [Micromonospora radicis]|uniref:Lipoprotein n=1 Tax=Micromonospora radicis TaxID=1894971 RepID=A0A418MPY5_9ACTN|nr:hypothetical protein [Micromonospora radicis]RIV35541.1 hypothetical protein D2L64_21580 [Micromonospora radicis]